MAICGTCGAESARVRSRWADKQRLPDQCPKCAPQSFEKQTDPSDKKIWIGPEVRPNDYEKRYDLDGIYYQPKPEATADLENRVLNSEDDKEAHERAIAKKRANRRKDPLTPLEIEYAIKRANEILRPMIEDKEITHLV